MKLDIMVDYSFAILYDNVNNISHYQGEFVTRQDDLKGLFKISTIYYNTPYTLSFNNQNLLYISIYYTRRKHKYNPSLYKMQFKNI